MRSRDLASFLVFVLAVTAACGSDDPAPAATGPVLTTPTTPAATGATTAVTVAPAAVATTVPTAATYTVQAGDSLFAIAEQLCTDLDTLVATNAWPDGVNHPIFPGDEITVPAGACTPVDEAPIASQAPTTVTSDVTWFEELCPDGCSITPYGDPGDAITIYDEGVCTDARVALQHTVSGPESLTGTIPLMGLFPTLDPLQVRTEGVRLWQGVIDAFAGFEEVPDDATTSLGRAGALEGEVTDAYIALLAVMADAARGADVTDEWDERYAAMLTTFDARSRNTEPIYRFMDIRCPARGMGI